MLQKKKKLNSLPVKGKKYDAFISYSHDADNSLASSLQSGLHNLAKPFYKLRAIRTFRDETDLTVTPTGWADLQSALSNSRYFILLASRKSADPEGGVKKEIDFWVNTLGRQTNLLIVLTDGNIIWDEQRNDFDWSQTNALPKILSNYFTEEPFWADLSWAQSEQDLSLRNPEFLNVVAKLSDPIRELDVNELISEDHRQHKRTKHTTSDCKW